MTFFPPRELAQRVRRFQDRLGERELDGALIHGVTNLLYFAGTAQQCHLWIPTSGEPILLVRRVLARARAESALAEVHPLTSLKALPEHLEGAGRIGMELDVLPVTLFRRYSQLLGDREVVDVGPLTRLVRSVKSELEVERVRASARAGDLVFQEVLAALTPGVTELEMSVVAEAASRRHGSQGILRWRASTGFECPLVHVLAGPSALDFSSADTPFGGPGVTPAVPYGAGHRSVEVGMPVCFDQALAKDGYIHDMTRTAVVGPLPRELMAGHDLCLEMLEALQAEARPGVTGEKLWQVCLRLAKAAGLEDQFMGYGENRVSFVGHGVGLELDELPILAVRQETPLESGQVIAVEPKIFYPGIGSVGLENTYVVREKGLEKLTETADELFVVAGGE